MGAAFGPGQGVDLVHDDVLDAAQDLGRLAGQDQVQRFGRGDEDVRRVADQVAPLVRRRVAGPDADLDLRHRLAQPLGRQADPGQRRPQVALDVVDQGLERRDVQDADRARRGRRARLRLAGQPIQAPQERGQGLATAGWGVDQRVAPGRDARPALGLGRSRAPRRPNGTTPRRRG